MQYRDFMQSIGLSEDIFNWTLDESYTKLKEFKASAKQHFLEDITKNEFRKFEKNQYIKVADVADEQKIIERDDINFENLVKFHPLFETTNETPKEYFDKFI